MEIVIGISGKLGTGKTTVAKILCSRFYDEFELFNFGDAVKKESSERYVYPLEWNYNVEGKKKIINHHLLPKKDMTVREVLQWHGTDFRREQDEKYWIKYMSDHFDNIISHSLIIDDVRFKNEAEFVKDNHGLLFRIDVPGLDTGSHRSETELDDYKFFNKRLETDMTNPYFSYINANIFANLSKFEYNILRFY